ncbi:hypothetical protein [Actinokineospora sp. NBRC 105648]|uniref:hypothetical protein n=1 Tax=Actinokineospora sp. NBRC 105648 TaxID=3032206 RepID=UPI0024A29613|nr:hypothetical protein [Actinokineospora sp. NBRC 105648]GLZ40068.1 hypothetical protein Acsp05_36920 [Actinokineospora sp. NBRC 105648]
MTYPGGEYQGFGVYQPPPKRGGGRVVVIAVVALVLIVAAVVTILLLNRGGTPEGQPTTTTGLTTTTTTTTTSRAPAGRTIANDPAKIQYEVPDAWVDGTDPVKLKSVPDVSIDHLAGLTEYRCGDKVYSRGVVGSGTVPRGEINQRATDLARAFGTEFYGSGSGVDVVVGTPKRISRETGGKRAVGTQVEATVTTTGDTCLAAQGKIIVVLLDIDGELRLLLVNGDMAGGPDTPPPPDQDDLAAIAASARPAG